MLRAVASNFAAQLLALTVAMAERLVLVGLMLRVWGEHQFADWTSLVALAGLLTMFEASLNIYFGNRWRQLHVLGDEREFTRLIGVSLFLYAVLGSALLAGAGIVAFCAPIEPVLHLAVLDFEDSRIVLLVLAASQVLQIMRGAVSQIYRGRGEFARGLMVDVAIAALSVCAIMFAVLAGAGPLSLAVVQLIVQGFAGSLILLGDLRRRYPEVSIAWHRPGLADLSAIAGAVRWLAIVQAAAVVLLHGPVLLLAAFGFGGAVVAGFVLMRTLANLGRSVAQMLALAVGVEVSSKVAAIGWHGSEPELRQAASVMALISAVLAAAVWLFGDAFMIFWAGRHGLFDQAVIGPLFGALLVVSPFLPLQAALLHANELAAIALIYLIQLVTAAGVAIWLVGDGGAGGLAAGLAAGEIAAVMIALPVFMRNRLSAGFFAGLYLRAALAVGLALGAVALGSGLINVIGHRDGWQSLATVAVWCAAMIAFTIGALSVTIRRSPAVPRMASTDE